MSPQTRGPEKKRVQRSAVHSAAEGLTQKSKARCGKVPKRVTILSVQLTGYWPPPTTRHGLWFGRSLRRESKRIHREYFIARGPQTSARSVAHDVVNPWLPSFRSFCPLFKFLLVLI
jgi:hypothetical protein